MFGNVLFNAWQSKGKICLVLTNITRGEGEGE